MYTMRSFINFLPSQRLNNFRVWNLLAYERAKNIPFSFVSFLVTFRILSSILNLSFPLICFHINVSRDVLENLNEMMTNYRKQFGHEEKK